MVLDLPYQYSFISNSCFLFQSKINYLNYICYLLIKKSNQMKSLKGSKTEINLLKAFAGECQALTRYDFFASQAKKEGLEQIAAIFTETGLNEKEHAKIIFKFLEGTDVEITAKYPAGKIGNTEENLYAAAKGESEEYTTLYPEFARIAEEEGYREVAIAFKLITKIEKSHAARYEKLHKNLEEGKVFKRDGILVWKCRSCGHLHEGKNAPETCPVCLHPQAFFEISENNY
jgi:rubrerythrin